MARVLVGRHELGQVPSSILSAKRLGMVLNLTALLEVSEDQAEPSSLKA